MNLETNNKNQEKGIMLVIPNPCGNIKETKMKNSGIEWIGEIPDDWEVKPVKRYFSHVKRIVGDDVDKYERLSLTMQGVLKRSKDDAEGLQPEKFNGYQILKQNELVFKLIDLENVNTSRVGISPFNGLVSPAYIILTNNKKDNTFYYYWFLNMYYQEIFNKLGDGGVRSALNASDVLSLPMVYLNNETQQRIATYLDKKCSKIEETIQNQQQVIEKLKAYKQSLITEAVTGKVKIANSKICGEYENYKDSKLKWLGDFKIPEKWNSIQIKSCVSIPVVDGPHESPELFDNGIPYISATAIENSKIDFSLKRGFISEKYCDECDKRYKPMKDDILMIKLGATTGQVAIVETDERFNIWVPLAAIRCKKNIALPKFVFYSFQSDYCLKQMEMSWTFGTQQTLGVSSIERLKIFLPNIETQKEIANYLDKKCTAIDTAIEQKQKLIVKLTEYKKSLIYECVTGKKAI
ncbi:restriction endonuclease subunit S [Treponema sp.]|uniref:restriction endonuclease subunit S n=1 Tax=Treponema sp. TaxID=166 RepID=UPI00298D9C69|nr:restriction endonuclease subunit S [Treponema sp.]